MESKRQFKTDDIILVNGYRFKIEVNANNDYTLEYMGNKT